MRCVIFGDRNVSDYNELLLAVKNSGFEITEILSGGAKGSDALGEMYAKRNGLKLSVYPADWDDLEASNCKIKTNGYGKEYNALAGFNRNQDMANDSECGIGLQCNGDTNGTQDMKKRLEKANKPVYILGPKESEMIDF
jgi:hypothetical protein